MPVKLDVVDDFNDTALYTIDEMGPTFGGGGIDLKIGPNQGDTCCSSNLGETYHVPPGYTKGTDKAKYFFTSKAEFAIDKIEVFYAYGKKSLKIGILCE